MIEGARLSKPDQNRFSLLRKKRLRLKVKTNVYMPNHLIWNQFCFQRVSLDFQYSISRLQSSRADELTFIGKRSGNLCKYSFLFRPHFLLTGYQTALIGWSWQSLLTARLIYFMGLVLVDGNLNYFRIIFIRIIVIWTIKGNEWPFKFGCDFTPRLFWIAQKNLSPKNKARLITKRKEFLSSKQNREIVAPVLCRTHSTSSLL